MPAMWAVLALGTGSLAAVAATSAGRAAGAYHVAHDAAMDKSKQDEARALYIGHLLTACIMVLTMAFFYWVRHAVVLQQGLKG